METFIGAASKLKKREILFVTHMILGLPGESREDVLDSAKLINESGSWGVKIHLLHLIKNTPLHTYYINNPFPLLEMEEYIYLVADILEMLNPDIVVHRITGDGSKETLAGPLWSLNKRAVLNGVDKILKERGTFQGKLY